jgi:hypothetical protein
MAKSPAAKKTAPAGVLSLKVTLRHTKPPIWRRILVKGGMNLGDLHTAIQICMGWMGSHLHAFDIGGEQYGDPTAMDDVANERRLTLNGLVKSGVTRFGYTYDFGDDWEHDILIEQAPPAGDGKFFPACIGGKRACPPEDCGGPPGYEDLLAVLADPAHPNHAAQLEWLGGEFDPEAFSIADTDAELGAGFHRGQPVVKVWGPAP